MSDVIVYNTTTPALHIEKVINFNGTASSFTISNIQYLNSTFEMYDTPSPLFVFSKLQYDFNFKILINDCFFSNLEYGLIEQNIFEFRHQLKSGIEVTNLRVQDTVNVHILFSASLPSLKELPTKVVFTNMTTHNVDCYLTSFMQMEAGVRVFFIDSTLAQIFTFGTGAVLHGKQADSEMVFTRSIIQLNSAMQAALFKMQQSSVVKIYNSTVQYNFAPDTGVMIFDSNARFEFYDSTFRENYAARTYFATLSVVTNAPIIHNCKFVDYQEASSKIIRSLIRKKYPECNHL